MDETEVDPDAKDRIIPMRLSHNQLKEIDEVRALRRGGIPRTVYMRMLLMDAVAADRKRIEQEQGSTS